MSFSEEEAMGSNVKQVVMVSLGVFALAVAAAAYFNINHMPPASASASSIAAAPARSGSPDRKAPEPERVTIPSGTPLNVRLDHAVSSKSAAGSAFVATVSDPIVVDGITAIPLC